jgi:hypothetical protein
MKGIFLSDIRLLISPQTFRHYHVPSPYKPWTSGESDSRSTRDEHELELLLVSLQSWNSG